MLTIADFSATEMEWLLRKCKREWKQVVINTIVHGYACFPDEWYI